MALSENKEISKRINDLGSLANAWTSYYGTNYNIFGSINLIENLKLLLDIFYNTNINEKSVELIKECVESMKDKKVLERLFDSAKKTINTYLNNFYDDLTSQINLYYQREFDTIEDIETLRENINAVTIDEVIKLNEKISLSTIYLLKGDN